MIVVPSLLTTLLLLLRRCNEGGLRIAQGLVKKFFVGVLVLEAQQRVSGGGVVELLGALDTVSDRA